MNIQEVYDSMNKSLLIKIYRQWLHDNEKFSKNQKKEGKYPHPIINKEKYSWADFRRLPRDAILVHIFTEGCNLEYISSLDDSWFTETRDWHPNFGNKIWVNVEEE